MAESEDELKTLLVRVKEESEKAGLKYSIQKTKIMASCPITSWQIEGGGGRWKQCDLKITADGDCSPMKLKDIYSLEEKLWQT